MRFVAYRTASGDLRAKRPGALVCREFSQKEFDEAAESKFVVGDVIEFEADSEAAAWKFATARLC